VKKLALIAMFVAACSQEAAKHKAAGNVLMRRGDLVGAEKEYRAALAIDGKDSNAHTLLGDALFEEEKYDEAARELDAALATDPNARAALQGRAMVHLRKGERDRAKALYERLVQNEPRDPEAQSALGKLLYASGDLDGAERHLRDALVWAQNDAAALYTLGLVLAKKKDRVQANAIFDRLDALVPGRAYAPYGRAVAAAVSNDADEALKQLAVALERGVDDLQQVENDEAFAALKSAPRFSQLVAAARTRAPPRKGIGPP
jgi:Tfp pilus assembly protein PilF